MSAGVADHLLSALNAEVIAFEALIERQRELRGAVLAGDADAVDRTAPAIDVLQRRIATHERERESAVAMLAALFGITVQRLRDMLPILDEDDSSAVAGVAERLRSAASEALALNRSNAQLLRRALVLTQRRVQLLQGASAGPYDAGGAAPAAVQPLRNWVA